MFHQERYEVWIDFQHTSIHLDNIQGGRGTMTSSFVPIKAKDTNQLGELVVDTLHKNVRCHQ